ncbi:MAG: hypothetical protein RLZZ427_791 [Pseudomonadota bacterium]|jgi:tight adherence protein C
MIGATGKLVAVGGLAILVAGAVILLVLEIGKFELRQRSGLRLKQVAQADPAAPQPGGGLATLLFRRFADALDRLKLKQRAANEQERQRFIQAGFRNGQSMRYFGIAKTALALALPAAVLLAAGVSANGHSFAGVISLGALAAVSGYLLPNLYLGRRISRRADLVRRVLPDLIDLTVICTESGLALDQALGRAVRELAADNPVVAEEFQLAALEIRAGAGRAVALRNLATRVRLEDLHNLSSILIQADRFGTSIAEGLRTHSEVMRLKRSQRAEEIASRIPTIILLPLIFCILPTLLLVIMGPAVVRLMTAF